MIRLNIYLDLPENNSVNLICWHFLVALKCVLRQWRDLRQNKCIRGGTRTIWDDILYTRSCLDSLKTDGTLIKLLRAFPSYVLLLIQYPKKWCLNLTQSGQSWFRLEYTHWHCAFFPPTLTHWNKK